MHRRHLLALSGALAAGALAGCANAVNPPRDDGDDSTDPGTDTEPGSESQPRTDTGEPGLDPDVADEDLAELVRGTNGLALDLYDELRDGVENVMASPVSVSTALAMAYAGARGDTREQMRDALRYTLDDEPLHAAFNALQRELAARGEDVDESDLPSNYDEGDDPVPFRLSLVNAAWGQEGYPFRDDYLGLLEDHYGGGLREVDYASPEAAREEINDWVADRTEDRIDDLLPEGALGPLTRLVLTNAVYFLANWQTPFEESRTEDGEFTALDGSAATVPMMRQDERLPYAAVDGATAVDLPYIGEEVSMLLILPPEGEFREYEAAFDATELDRIVDALEPREGSVSLPRFEFESSFELRGVLESLGMPIAFDPQAADFSGMARLDETEENLSVDDVYHDTFIAVDEEGTEAAAATGAVMKATSAPPDPFEFVADRPFLFAVRDRPTGTVLFLGRLSDAGAAQ